MADQRNHVCVRLSLLVTSLLVMMYHPCAGADDESGTYGVDVSFPIQHGFSRERQGFYNEFMRGCKEKYKKRPSICDSTEADRFSMSERQPQSMVNYTSTGFMKIKAPDSLINLLVKHWERNKDSKKEEKWPAGNTYTNHWAAPTYMVSVEDTGLRGGGSHLKNAVWDAAKDTIEQWTGMELKPISQYGIRMYTEGAVLAPHVDRLPLVSSCIVNVAQDVDEDWPLEVYDRNGNAVNVTMQPGDMVLYESHSLIHGRPFPLKGRYFANIFIHFEPTGKRLFETEFNSDHDVDDDLPPYIIKGSPEVENWKRRNPGGWKKMPSPSAAHVDSPEVHAAAASGDVEHLQRIAKVDKKKLDQKDRNGWAPIHEAARGGQKEAAELLVRHGADVNHRTNRGKGPTPLHLVILNHGERHPLAQYLKEIGALDIGPEL